MKMIDMQEFSMCHTCSKHFTWTVSFIPRTILSFSYCYSPFSSEETEAQTGFVSTEGCVTEILAAELMLCNHCAT